MVAEVLRMAAGAFSMVSLVPLGWLETSGGAGGVIVRHLESALEIIDFAWSPTSHTIAR